MRKFISIVASLALLLTAVPQQGRAVQSTCEYSVQVSATVQADPARITLSWPQDSCTPPKSYTIYRKAPEATAWGRGTRLPGTATTYTDTKVTPGVAYEYQVVKQTPLYRGYGYLLAGIEAPMIEQRGRLLLVVDQTYATELTNELAQLEQDLVGDGWSVQRLDVRRNDSVRHVKELIQQQYQADPANVRCVFLFGHIPVPYAGNIVPDGHVPGHQGAWPCDGYYGDMDGLWTDDSVNVTCASDPRNRNVPGDGKFDQSTFPAPLKLMVGRVDMAKMPGRHSYGGPATFPSELELLRNYLIKDHRFRTRQFALPRRGIVGDYFGIRDGEAFAASGWRNFAAFFGAANVSSLPLERTWISTLHTNAYLWAYGCGAGTYTSMAGLGTANSYNDGLTTDLVQGDPKAVFTLLYGSWLGDWDSEDDLLRSVLATSSYGLTSAWSGRPHWFLHHMALGAPIGFSTRLTQNNGENGLYRNQSNNGAGQIHIALMGDPTLRMHMVAPAKNLAVSVSPTSSTLHWDPSPDDVLGYYVYGAANPEGPFLRLTKTLVPATNVTLRTPFPVASYMVRALKLEASGSGTYYNLSQGTFAAPATSTPSFAQRSIPGGTSAGASAPDTAPSPTRHQPPARPGASPRPTGITRH